MRNQLTLMALTAASFGMTMHDADASIIRTSGPGDPYLAPASYSYATYVTDENEPGGFDGISKRDQASKPYPISISSTGHVCGNDNGSCTLLTSQAKTETSDDHLGIVKASVSTSGHDTSATATLIYYFTLVGPDAPSVPVTISGYGMADAHPGSSGLGATSLASITVDYYNGVPRYPANWTHTISTYESGSFSHTIDIAPNQNSFQGAPRIVLKASALVLGGWQPENPQYYAGSSSSWIDPLISIEDPELAKLYTIVVSLSSVSSGPVSPVPLPPSVVMFGAALLALGAFGYGVKRRKAAAAA